MKASIVIANYNNSKYIENCINSLNSQTYNNIEIIFFDDNSKDNSVEIIKKFNNVKIIENKNQTNFGSFNQMNAFKKAIKSSTGDIIFLLDSDDWFKNEKIEKIVNIFLNDKNKKIIFDFPIIVKNNTNLYRKKMSNTFKTYWGYIHPTSCISMRKSFVNKIFDSTLNENFPNIWLDFRVLLYAKYINNYEVIEQNLTFYRQTNENVSSKFKKFTKSWWQRRKEAHDYFFNFMKKNNLAYRKNLDYYVTKAINKFI